MPLVEPPEEALEPSTPDLAKKSELGKNIAISKNVSLALDTDEKMDDNIKHRLRGNRSKEKESFYQSQKAPVGVR